MADYVSKYTGAQIDLSVASGSSTTGTISGSFDGTGSFGRLLVAGDTNLTGDITVGGNLTLGDADTDSVSISADLTSNLIPNAAATYNIGSATKDWNYLFVNGINATDISASGNISASGHLYIPKIRATGSVNTLEISASNIYMTGSVGLVTQLQQQL